MNLRIAKKIALMQYGSHVYTWHQKVRARSRFMRWWRKRDPPRGKHRDTAMSTLRVCRFFLAPTRSVCHLLLISIKGAP
jgi:hypothetical protein